MLASGPAYGRPRSVFRPMQWASGRAACSTRATSRPASSRFRIRPPGLSLPGRQPRFRRGERPARRVGNPCALRPIIEPYGSSCMRTSAESGEAASFDPVASAPSMSPSFHWAYTRSGVGRPGGRGARVAVVCRRDGSLAAAWRILSAARRSMACGRTPGTLSARRWAHELRGGGGGPHSRPVAMALHIRKLQRGARHGRIDTALGAGHDGSG
jgi:hypothetical protein